MLKNPPQRRPRHKHQFRLLEFARNDNPKPARRTRFQPGSCDSLLRKGTPAVNAFSMYIRFLSESEATLVEYFERTLTLQELQRI
jgi:hypothetical protein